MKVIIRELKQYAVSLNIKKNLAVPKKMEIAKMKVETEKNMFLCKTIAHLLASF